MSISVILPSRSSEAERSHHASLWRHDDADGPIHERGLRELREVSVEDRALGPFGRAAGLAQHAGDIRAHHEIGIEEREQAFEVARAQRRDERLDDLALPPP